MGTIKNRNGSALIVAILSLAVLLILSTTMVSISSSNFEMSHAERRYQSAYYVAEAGIRHQIEHMHIRMQWLHSRAVPPANAEAFFTAFNGQIADAPQMLQNLRAEPLLLQNLGSDPARADIIDMTVTPNTGNQRRYTFTSSARVGNIRRTIQGSVTLQWAMMQPPVVYFDRALFTDGTLVMKNNARIEGGVGTNASASNSISLHGSASIIGGVLVGKGGGSNTIEMKNGGNYTGGLTVSSQNRVLPSVIIPGNLPPRGAIDLGNSSALSISQNGSYSEFRLRNNSHVTFHVTQGDLAIVINGDLILDNSATIRTIGDGRLYIFVQGSVRLRNSSANLNDNQSQNNLFLFVNGNEIQLDNSSRLRGGIYAPNAFLDMKNDSQINGAAVVNRADLDNSSRIIYNMNDRINEIGLEEHLSSIPGYIPPENMFRVERWQEP